MNLGPHAFFIVAAYVMAGLVIASMIAWILADHRRQRQTLRELETRGLTRRSNRRTEMS